MQDLFVHASLGVLGGPVIATVLVVDFLKEFAPLKRLPTRALVVIVAEAIVFLASVAAGSFSVKNLPPCVFNGFLVAASAMGSWQVVHDRLFGGSGKAKKE